MDATLLRKELLKTNAELEIAQRRVTEITMEVARKKSRIDTLEKCRQLVLQVGRDTQTELKSLTESTVTLALQSVYGLNYKFVVKFNYDKRDQLEVAFFVDKNGLELEPRKDTMGYGVVDICSFSLRMVMWMLSNPQTAPLIVLDEPFKNASAKFVSLISEMVKQVSEMLGVQFIISTHIDGMIERADTVYHLTEEGETE
jgi:DNA repair exonuclease SbcCD ATPase subunit